MPIAWTNYYTVPFETNEAGEVEIEQIIRQPMTLFVNTPKITDTEELFSAGMSLLSC